MSSFPVAPYAMPHQSAVLAMEFLTETVKVTVDELIVQFTMKSFFHVSYPAKATEARKRSAMILTIYLFKPHF